MTSSPASQQQQLPDAAETAAALARELAEATPATIVMRALEAVGREKLAVVSSFGTESAALLKIVADIDPAVPVVFLDTGWLFQETLDYRDTLTRLLGLGDVRTIRPLDTALRRSDPHDDLWLADADACCHLRKVEPLALALAPFAAWFNGRKRFQGGDRANLAVVEADGARLKFNPLAKVTAETLTRICAAAGLPAHPLLERGFTSVGCMPCTTRTRAGEDPRAGRWRDRGKTECGIHVGKVS